MQALDTIAVHRLRVPLTVPYRLAFGPVEHFDTIIAEATDRDAKKPKATPMNTMKPMKGLAANQLNPICMPTQEPSTVGTSESASSQ